MKLLATTFVATALIALPASAHDLDTKRTGVLHATASGSADVAPDRATVTAGVQSQAPTANEAMAMNSEKMRRVFEALKRAGVNERDIATSYLSLQPNYDFDPQTRQRRDNGYQVNNQVTIATSDIDDVGVLIDALLEAGLNNIQNVNFTVRDRDAAQDKARRAAIRKARDKAEDMAEAAGVELGELLVVTESAAPGAFMEEIVMTGTRTSAALSAAPPLSPGQREISATVTLSYAID